MNFIRKCVMLIFPVTLVWLPGQIQCKNITNRNGRSTFLPPTVTSFQHHSNLAARHSSLPWTESELHVGRQVGGGSPVYMSRPSHMGLNTYPSPQYMRRMGRHPGRISPAATGVVMSREPELWKNPGTQRLSPRLSIPQSDMANTDRTSKKRRQRMQKSNEDSDGIVPETKKKKNKSKGKLNKKINVNNQEQHYTTARIKAQEMWPARTRHDTFGIPISEDLSHLQNPGLYYPEWKVEYPTTTDRMQLSQDIWTLKRSYPPHFRELPSQHPDSRMIHDPVPQYPSISKFPKHSYDNNYIHPSYRPTPRYNSWGQSAIANNNPSFTKPKLPEILKVRDGPDNEDIIFFDEDLLKVDTTQNLDSPYNKKKKRVNKNRKSRKHGNSKSKIEQNIVALVDSSTEANEVITTTEVPQTASTADYYDFISSMFEPPNITTETNYNYIDHNLIHADEEMDSIYDYTEDITTIMPEVDNENRTNERTDHESTAEYDFKLNPYNDPMPTEWYIGETIPTKKEPISAGYKFPKHFIIIASCILGTLAFFTVFVLIAYTVVKCSKKPDKNNYEVSTQKTSLSNNNF